tara:strand:- start:14987 stop:15847 length:861 start_codon:yes stop_codon:yes gene_type:complete
MSLAPLPLVVLLGMLQFVFGGYFFIAMIQKKVAVASSRKGFLTALCVTYVPFTYLMLLMSFNLIDQIDELNFISFDGLRMILQFSFVLMAIFSSMHFLIIWRSGSQKIFSSLKLRIAINNILIAISISILFIIFLSFQTTILGLVLLVLHSAITGFMLGGANTAMTWGHWYLVTPSLPKEPLVFLTGFLIKVIFASFLFFILMMILQYEVLSLAKINSLNYINNPALWLRFLVGIGLTFPLVYFAFKASQINGMMTATGLLYLSLGAILAGAFLSNALLFEIGIPT